MAVYAYESVSVADSAVGLTAATYDTSIAATISVESGAVRYRVDGTDPSATEGHALEVGDVLKLYNSNDIQKVKFIRRDGVSATLRVSYIV